MFEIQTTRQKHLANPVHISIGCVIFKNQTLPFETLVKQVYLFEKIQIDLRKFEFFFGTGRRRSRRRLLWQSRR